MEEKMRLPAPRLARKKGTPERADYVNVGSFVILFFACPDPCESAANAHTTKYFAPG